jgi:hypothetical protein
MYCPQCGVRSDQPTKFCKSCGCKLELPALPLAVAREIVPGPFNREEAMRQLRWLKGTRWLLTGAAFLPFSMFTAFVAAVAGGGDAEVFAVMTFFLLSGALCTSGWGIINLLRGGFFKTYKERRVRAEAALLAQPVPPPQVSFEPPPETNRLASRSEAKRQSEATSITEPTTRTLRPVSGDANKVH